MKIVPTGPAFPVVRMGLPSGLTVRAYFAAQFMGAMVARTGDFTDGFAARLAVERADALIAALNKESE